MVSINRFSLPLGWKSYNLRYHKLLLVLPHIASLPLQGHNEVFPTCLCPRFNALAIVLKHRVSHSDKFVEGSDDAVSKLRMGFGELNRSKEEGVPV